MHSRRGHVFLGLNAKKHWIEDNGLVCRKGSKPKGVWIQYAPHTYFFL